MDDERIDLVFKAVAHAERRRIISTLYVRPRQSLFELCSSSLSESGKPLSRQTISQHLDLMERAGLLECSWQGRTKLHSVNLDLLREAIASAISQYL